MFKLDIPLKLKEEIDELRRILFENGEVLKMSCRATGFHIYLVDHLNRKIILETKKNHDFSMEKLQWNLDEPSIVAAYVARTCTVVLASPVFGDNRFPDGIPWRFQARAVLCLPVLSMNDACAGVIELFREKRDNPFTEEEMKFANVIVGWMGAHFSSPNLRTSSVRGNQIMLKIHQIMMEMLRSSLREDSEEDVICQFLIHIKDCVNADRISFFQHEYKDSDKSLPVTCSLYDDGFNIQGPRFVTKKSVNFGYTDDIGTAWHATQEKKSINLHQPYSDPRFSKKSDLLYNYKTNSLLTFPVIFQDIVKGAVSVMNKVNGPHFTSNDEFICSTMADYLSLILHYYSERESLSKMERKWKDTEKMLLYQLHPSDRKMEKVLATVKTLTLPRDFLSFNWFPIEEDSLEALAVYMLKDTLDATLAANIPKIVEFVLTVRNSYRPLHYHNFEHAVTVMHCAYIILKKNKERFTHLEETALVVASICHDSDHLGVTNSFLKATNHVLSQLYESSQLEFHHFHFTAAFIQDLGLFEHWSKPEFNKVMDEIKNNIISTDLMVFFEKKEIILRLQKKKQFSLNLKKHRSLMKSIVMNGCDLSANCKPFTYAKKITQNLCEEFYLQGDKEKELGVCPAEMMNRNLSSRLPEEQVNFYAVVALPCFSLLATLIPNTKVLYDGCLEIQRQWKLEILQKNQQMWRWEESYRSKET